MYSGGIHLAIICFDFIYILYTHARLHAHTYVYVCVHFIVYICTSISITDNDTNTAYVSIYKVKANNSQRYATRIYGLFT